MAGSKPKAREPKKETWLFVTRRKSPQYFVQSMSKSINPVQVEPDATEQARRTLDAIAATFEHFDLIVEALDPAAGQAVDEVVGDLLHPVLQRREEFVEASQTALFDFRHPSA